MPPPSLEKLSRRLDEIHCLMRIARSRRTRKARNINNELPAVLRGSIVLLSSHIEGYFEDLVHDIILNFDENARTAQDFPNSIRVRQVLGDPKKWTTEDVTRRWAILRGATAAPLFSDDCEHVSGLLDATLHTEKFSNPGTGEIKNLFQTVGVEDCWREFSSIEPRVAYKSEIDSIVSRRNQIAHGNMNAQVTDTDISNYLINFRHTAEVFSELSEIHIRKHLSNFRWSAAIVAP